jgi:cell fate (sporulation/competence/biofilm development) regulator YmcA (YheA/YmcA/DUF963 family)
MARKELTPEEVNSLLARYGQPQAHVQRRMLAEALLDRESLFSLVQEWQEDFSDLVDLLQLHGESLAAARAAQLLERTTSVLSDVNVSGKGPRR